jgi:tetratricopeptide (TPR) repeat protein
VNYGTALHQLGRYREAIGPLEIAHFQNQRSIEVCNLLGACLLKIGDPQRAVTIFTIATHVSPQDSVSWSNLSIALNANFEHDRALIAAERAVELSRDPANALEAQAAAQLELGKIEEAVVTYKKSVDLSPTLVNLRGLSRALISSGRHDEAIRYIRRAIEVDPGDVHVRLQAVVAVLKPIYNNIPEMEASRVAFGEAMAELQSWFDDNLSENAFVSVGAMQPFFIAYHPFNNKDLLSRFGDISVRLMRTMPLRPIDSKATGTKMRIGIVSGHVFNQSVWIAILKGWTGRSSTFICSSSAANPIRKRGLPRN